MPGNEENEQCLRTLLIVLVCVAVFHWFINPHLSDVNESFTDDLYAELDKLGTNAQPSELGSEAVPADNYFIDVGNPRVAIHHNLCSKSCCSPQWPTPFNLKEDKAACANKSKYVPSNIMCNNAYQDSGCLCLSKEQNDFLNRRGGNATFPSTV